MKMSQSRTDFVHTIQILRNSRGSAPTKSNGLAVSEPIKFNTASEMKTNPINLQLDIEYTIPGAQNVFPPTPVSVRYTFDGLDFSDLALGELGANIGCVCLFVPPSTGQQGNSNKRKRHSMNCGFFALRMSVA